METFKKSISFYQQLSSGLYKNEFTIDYLVEMGVGFEKLDGGIIQKRKKPINENFRDVIKEIEKYSMDLTPDYNCRLVVGLAMASEYGDKARNYYHRICKINEEYDEDLCNKEYSKFLQNNTSFFPIDIVHILFTSAYGEAIRYFNMKQKNDTNDQTKDNNTNLKQTTFNH